MQCLPAACWRLPAACSMHGQAPAGAAACPVALRAGPGGARKGASGGGAGLLLCPLMCVRPAHACSCAGGQHTACLMVFDALAGWWVQLACLSVRQPALPAACALVPCSSFVYAWQLLDSLRLGATLSCR
jgi:hypothetical protein